ncbi:unnamed protein product [Paramecium octaurelia]|uniref:WD40-repeat-containing domain n=1 Tax=Paramecium octaurelia TaxID=43137 RepID=A0A8S1YP08_PAROT|nr:unnamed protein product [Paramecium octaurelia]
METQPQLKQFSYELQPSNQIKKNINCQAIAINKQNKFVIVTSDSKILVIFFKNGQLKKLATIIKHKKDVSTLNFFNYNSNFVSGSQSVIIWPLSLISNQKYIQKISGHAKMIQCLALHPSEFLIVSGSSDATIQFWFNYEQQLNNQKITDHKDSVFGLAINKEGNRIVSCGKDKLILIIEKSNSHHPFWQVRQTITSNEFGYRICFINDNAIAFQPISYYKGYNNGTDHLHIYTPDEDQIYTKSKEIMVAGGGQICHYYFPSIYNSNKEILLVKNGYMVSLLRINDQFKGKNQYIFFNCLKFYKGLIIGTLSEDGEYFITWDAKSKEIQIRKYQETE